MYVLVSLPRALLIALVLVAGPEQGRAFEGCVPQNALYLPDIGRSAAPCCAWSGADEGNIPKNMGKALRTNTPKNVAYCCCDSAFGGQCCGESPDCRQYPPAGCVCR